MLLRKESSYATPSSRIMTSPTKPVKKPAYEMIVFSHLRWDFVYQRPQHLISRLSKTRKTLFIEEPIGKGPNQSIGYEIEVVSSTLSVLKPKVDTIYDIHKILRQLQIQEIPIAWFYSPSFMELMPFIEPKKVIYDCMDELSLFKGAPTTIKEQEQELMKVANVIFTGGRSLFESKSKQQKNVHCFPSSVDLVHFKKATDEIKIPDDLKEIPKPTIGYIGVIDERIDMKLLAETAKIMPDYSFVMIGPLAKIGEADLAKGDNIHYLGMKSYNELPNYLAGLDYTMMPFALNDATRFISPNPQFTARFVALTEAFLNYHRKMSPQIPWIIPINEISFLSWHSGDVRGTVPFAVNSGFDIKYHLCKASIAAMHKIRESFPETVILAVEPLVKVHPAGMESDFLTVFEKHEIQYQAMDILTGRMSPELGGDESLIDVFGANYYYNNQWNDLNQTIPWPDAHGLLTPFSDLLEEVYGRYGYPIVITETGHFGLLRKQWMKEIFVEVATAMKNNVPIHGLCIYPVIDRPDWDDLSSFSNCGIWDMDSFKNRKPHQPYIESIREGQDLFEKLLAVAVINPAVNPKKNLVVKFPLNLA